MFKQNVLKVYNKSLNPTSNNSQSAKSLQTKIEAIKVEKSLMKPKFGFVKGDDNPQILTAPASPIH